MGSGAESLNGIWFESFYFKGASAGCKVVVVFWFDLGLFVCLFVLFSQGFPDF